MELRQALRTVHTVSRQDRLQEVQEEINRLTDERQHAYFQRGQQRVRGCPLNDFQRMKETEFMDHIRELTRPLESLWDEKRRLVALDPILF